ncbi:hypothetical protein GGS24DRAFT_514508 [Hypoxylon argillaceum]|nr:hypothetical protein GGS24DRAFT_514508 [Hypoxylon argillaceum]
MECVLNPPEPIAIVGSSCRFPGDVASPSALFDLLCKPHDLSREVPSDRFSAKGFYHKDGKYHGTTNSIKAYWLSEHPRFFDAAFFSINPREAEALDPQQRLLLEVVFEAMEAAGFPTDRYSGEEIGAFSGCMTQDYETLSARDELAASPHFVVGNSRAIMSNRLSHFFDFRGPSMSIDTACSSSLVALDTAVQNLRSNNCTVACVTGANLMYTPDQFIVESTLGMLSPSGKCHMWDTRADGYARGEGIAAIIVKRLSRAIADGDRIEGVIRDVGVNADGRTAQLTEPNPLAQAALIRKTYEKSGLDPRNPSHRCQYFEAHGTGTQAGDPREAKAIHEAFFGSSEPGQDDVIDESSSSSPNKKLLVGSIKTVIGHTEAASGLAGLLKTLWSMKHGLIPPNLHFENLNPEVKPHYIHLQIPVTMTPWPDPSPGEPRRASVNSFGFGGTNSHAIVEAYTPEVHGAVSATRPRTASVRATGVLATQPHPNANPNSDAELTQANPISSSPIPSPVPFRLPVVISAASPKSLRDVAQSYRTYIANGNFDIRELAWHQHARRSDLLYRVAFSAGTTAEALEALDSLLLENASSIPVEKGLRLNATKPTLRILGIFTGQGAQWATMSTSLLQHNHVYRDTIRKLDATLKACPHPCPWTLEEQLIASQDASRIQEAAVSQPLCTALQIALVDFLRSVGIDFHTVIGHSSGEIAAAYAAGKLSAEDAIVVSYYRGMVAHLAGGPSGQAGGMVATSMSESEAVAFCRDILFRGRIRVAASNSPSSTTLSGDLEFIDVAIGVLNNRKKGSKKLRVDTAYHSVHMTWPAFDYIKVMRDYGVSPLQGNGTVWISSVKDRPRTEAQDLDCQYWADNMVHQVQFREAVEYALSQPDNRFDCAIEVGPHPALQGPFTQTAIALGRVIPYCCPLNRTKDNDLPVSDFLGFMWSTFGPAAINMGSYIEQSPMPEILLSRLGDLPAYPFDHSIGYWRDSRISHEYNFRKEAPHELLGIRGRENTMNEMKWRNILRPDMLPWLGHHSFQDQPLLPASAYCIMALDAARSSLAGRPASLVELMDVEILSGIAIDTDGPGVETHFCLNVLPSEENSSTMDARFALYSRPAQQDGSTKLKMNATGSLHIVLGGPSMRVLPSRHVSLSETFSADPDAFYDMMKAAGLTYTGPFRAITSIQRRFGYCSATLARVHPDETTGLKISPATLDACFQSAFLSYASPGDRSLWTSFLPTRISKIQFNLAALEGEAAGDPKAVLTADTHLAACTPPTEASTAAISVDIAIYNEAGEPEIQVEELVVRALANTRPKDDVDLYLHTVLDVDPTDEIVHFGDGIAGGDDALLAESCRRIAFFYLDNQLAPGIDMRNGDNIESSTKQPRHAVMEDYETTKTGQWGETQESIDTMILKSTHADYLNSIQSAGKVNPVELHKRLSFIEEEARQVVLFRNHVGRIMKQITHRYPWMNILDLATEQAGLTRSILAAIGDSFQSFIVNESQDATIQSVEGVRGQDIDLDKNLGEQLGLDGSLDLVILPTTLLDNDDPAGVLKNIGEVMKSGGFLVLIDPYTTTLDAQSSKPFGDRTRRPLTPPLWQDALDSCDFAHQARNSDQFHPGGSIAVRQFLGSSISPQIEDHGIITDKLLLLQGPPGTGDDSLVTILQAQLSASCNDIIHRSLDDATTEELEACSAAIMLADLDEPLMPNMTEHRINQLRTLLRPTLTMLWVTRESRSNNPDHAASFGFLRTMAAEVPALKLQVLDLDTSEAKPPAKAISSAFSRLVLSDKDANAHSMWTFEPEIHIEAGRRLIPRVMPWKAGNDRANALRRVVTRSVNTLQHCVEIRPERDALRFRLRDTEQAIGEPPRGYVMIRVDYSSACPIKLGEDACGYACVGREWKTGERMVALSATNSSYVTCLSAHAIALQRDAPPSLVVLYRLVRCMAALASVSAASYNDRIIFVDPDVEFAKWVVDIAAPGPIGRQRVMIVETYGDEETTLSRFADIVSSDQDRYKWLFLHTRASTRDVKQAFSRGRIVFNFLPEDHELSQRITTSVPRECTVYPGLTAFDAETCMRKKDYPVIKIVWERAMTLSMQSPQPASQCPDPMATVSLNELNSQPVSSNQPFTIINWKTDRDAVQSIAHTITEQLFSPDKTYYLFGITRDFGHSLCRLFVSRGARHIVLASRRSSATPQWVTELENAYDATIRMACADVTSIASLRALRLETAKTMPAPGGVVNGAMVLEDISFAQMTASTWSRVLAPKTTGSANLAAVFGERDLDFFIMTSSFAAIGGHAGQSNYAAANMYMNGLAAARRRRGLAGAALNIGVIYGLGFLHRERGDLYKGLEREGYPPVSEHDLHHMFLEAIVAGRPAAEGEGGGGPLDITTGLRRFRRGWENPLHWHVDPRFGHFAVRARAADEGEAEDVGAARKSLREELAGLEEKDAVADVIVAAFVQRLQTLLGLPEGSIDQHSSVTDLGLDSISAAEIRGWFMKNLGNQFAVMKILNAPSIKKLCMDSAEQYLTARAETKDASSSE